MFCTEFFMAFVCLFVFAIHASVSFPAFHFLSFFLSEGPVGAAKTQPKQSSTDIPTYCLSPGLLSSSCSSSTTGCYQPVFIAIKVVFLDFIHHHTIRVRGLDITFGFGQGKSRTRRFTCTPCSSCLNDISGSSSQTYFSPSFHTHRPGYCAYPLYHPHCSVSPF